MMTRLDFFRLLMERVLEVQVVERERGRVDMKAGWQARCKNVIKGK